jgi:hypothetical protein
MKSFKQYIAKSMIGKSLYIKCDCPMFPINGHGIIKDYEIVNNEILFKVLYNGKLISLGENHPNLKVTDFEGF